MNIDVDSLAQWVAKIVGWGTTTSGLSALLIMSLCGKITRKIVDILLTAIILGILFILLSGGNPLEFFQSLASKLAEMFAQPA